MPPACPEQLVGSVVSRVFAAPERVDAAEWAVRHRRVVGGATDGPWDFSRTPYLRGVCLAYSDDAVRWVSVMKAEQVGGTEAMINCLMWGVDQKPGSTLWIYPNEHVARVMNIKRVLPSVHQTPRVAAILGTGRSDQNILDLNFTNGSDVAFRGSNSDANVEAFSRRRVFIDEIDRCVPEIAAKVVGRLNAFPDGKGYDNATPTDDGFGIHARYQTSDRCRWWTPCPECGHFHVRDDFSRVSWPMEPGKPLSADPDGVERSAWYACPACEHHITPAEHFATSQRGVWLPAGWEVDEFATAEGDPSGLAEAAAGRLPAWCVRQLGGAAPVYRGGKLDGETLPDAPPPPSSHAGFHICGEMSTIVANPFGSVAREFVASRGHPGTEWLNRRRGLPFRVSAKRVEAAELRKLCVPVAEGGYRLGQCPPGTLALTLAVDVQQREAYCTVRGWGANGRQSALVWSECVPIDAEAGEFGGIVRVLAMRFAMRDDPSRTLGIGATGIDSGDFTERVYGLVATLLARGVPNVWAVKGDGGRAVVHPIHETRVDLSKKSRFSVPVGLLVLKVNYWKMALAGRIHGEELTLADAGDAGGAPPGRGFMLPENAGEEYLTQLTAEERVLEHVSGQPVYVFKPRRGMGGRNHYWDTEVYSLAVAKRAGVDMLTAGAVPGPVAAAPRRERPGSLRGAGRGMLDWKR